MNFEIFSTASDLYTLMIGFFSLSLFVFLVYIYLKDKNQKKHSLRRNYPLLARGRWLMESVGHFFRYYMVANDREEKPFNRSERTWAYKAAKNNGRTEAFGSTLDYRDQEFSLMNSMFPYIPKNEEDDKPSPITYGKRTLNPYTSNSRVNISGMSYGALSDVAVLSLSRGAALGKFLMNTGEGGLSKFHVEGGADIIYQIGTAKYGCDNTDLTLNVNKLKILSEKEQIKMFEIKLSQGAKPGKGGILPASKVTQEIANARGIPVGTASISPNGHVEVHDQVSLLELLFKVKVTTGKPTGIKLCIGSEFEFEELIKLIRDKFELKEYNYLPDFITIDSSDGGTGAAPQAHMDVMGLNIKESLPFVINILKKYGLREEIKVIASGKLITPVAASWAFCLGVDSINIGRGFLFSLGCIQSLKCSKNTCPTGITTHDKRYTNGLVPEEKYVRVYNYQKNLQKDLMDIAHSCGVRSFDMLSQKHIKINNRIRVKLV